MKPVFAISMGLALALAALSASAAPALPNPCKLITVAEIEQIAGPLKAAPKATDPASGEVACTFSPRKGPDFIEIALHDGDLAAWKTRNGGKNPAAAPEFGSGAFVTPDFQDFAELYAKKGNLVLRVSAPKGAQSVELVKSVARKALPRL